MNEASSHMTTQETESMYTKAEVKRAKQAYQLASTSEYPSVLELINLVEDGNVSGIPGINRLDIKRACEIYGASVAYICGKMTKKKVSRVQYSEELKATDMDQVMYLDVMTLDGQKSLLSVSVPLHLIICTVVMDESEQVLGTALQGQLQTLRERGFTLKVVNVDPHSTFVRLRTQYLWFSLMLRVLRTMYQ